MPMFMDVHTRGDTLATLRDSAHSQAHARTAGPTPRGHHVHYLRYWVDEARGKVFCLVDAPDTGAPAGVHRRAYSLLAKEIPDDQDVPARINPARINPARINPARFDTAEIYRLQEGE